jgi:hypothetical protein
MQPGGYPQQPGYPHQPGYPPHGYVPQTAPGAPYPSMAVPAGSTYSLLPQTPLTERQLHNKFYGGWGKTIVVLLVGIFGVVMGGIAVHGYMKDRKYEKEGIKVDGYIVGTHTVEGRTSKGRRTYTHYVDYRFSDKSGEFHSGKESVSLSEKENFDDQLRRQPFRRPLRHQIEYFPDDITENRLVLVRTDTGHYILASIGVTLLTGAAALWHFSHKSARRRTAVVFNGKLHPGQVLVSESRGSGKSLRHVMQYRYADANGSERMSKLFNVKPDSISRYPVGSIIPVLIDPADPKQRAEPDLYGIRANG